MQEMNWDIIERHLAGECSEKERQSLLRWLDARPEHRIYYERVADFYRREGMFRQVTDTRAELSWQRFRSVMPAPDLLASKRKRSRQWVYAGFAAALLGALIFLPFLFRPEAASSGGDTGPSRVQLITSEGVWVDLEKQQADSLQDRSVLIANDGKALYYQSPVDSVAASSGYNTVVTLSGGEYILCLSDGSRIYLGPCSSVHFPVAFHGTERRVVLEGEAYFEVATDSLRVFIVETPHLRVEVLGTCFNLRAYADESHVETTLAEGSVLIAAADTSCLLQPGEQALWEKKAGKLSVAEVNILPYTAWKEGRLVIRNQRLEEIFSRLSKWYDFTVEYTDPDTRDLRFYTDMDRYVHLHELLDKLEKTGEISFKATGSHIRIYR